MSLLYNYIVIRYSSDPILAASCMFHRCCLLMCILSDLADSFLSQRGQLVFGSWRFLWSARFWDDLAWWLQTSHSKDTPAVWMVFLWALRASWLFTVFPHMLQASLSWLALWVSFMCLLKLLSELVLKLQTPQTCSIFWIGLCMFSLWVLKCWFVVNPWSQLLHWNFLSGNFLAMFCSDICNKGCFSLHKRMFSVLRFTADCFLWPKYDDIRPNHTKKTSQELGNCPMGQREALLKERFYQTKALLK